MYGGYDPYYDAGYYSAPLGAAYGPPAAYGTPPSTYDFYSRSGYRRQPAFAMPRSRQPVQPPQAPTMVVEREFAGKVGRTRRNSLSELDRRLQMSDMVEEDPYVVDDLYLYPAKNSKTQLWREVSCRTVKLDPQRTRTTGYRPTYGSEVPWSTYPPVGGYAISGPVEYQYGPSTYQYGPSTGYGIPRAGAYGRR